MKKDSSLHKLLAIILSLAMMLSMSTFAFGEEEPVSTGDNEIVDLSGQEESDSSGESVDEAEEIEAEEPVEASSETEEKLEEPPATVSTVQSVSDYGTFIDCLKILEGYAEGYVESHSDENANALVINYIRTGVDRYQSGTWATLAGAENTGFSEYVLQKDSEKGTSASALKNLNWLILPNGDVADFGHMFGTMDVSNYAVSQGMTPAVCLARADLGGWAGDTADMMFCAENVDIPNKVDTSETDIDKLSKNIKDAYLGVDYSTLNDVDHSFTSTDLFGDLDAFYIINELNKGSADISSVIENYFTSTLSDSSRAAYLLKNRFNDVKTKADIRNKVYNEYKNNTLVQALEGSYELLDLSNHDTLQKACCYAFADYLFELAGDDSGESPVDPGDEPGDDNLPENGYYTIFSDKQTTLAPGVKQNITYALTADQKQIVYYTATVDTTRDDIHIFANYHDNDARSWAMARVSDQIAAAQRRHSNPDDPDNYIENYNVIVGTNADFYNMTTGEPGGALIMEGVEYHGASNENFFGILNDGTPVIGSKADYAKYKNQLKEAVGGSIYLVKDGKSVISSSSTYYKSRASRTCVGITADNKVVMMVLDGRQEPFSAGGSSQEIAQIMVEAGCVTAINLDGGGSTTFIARQEGADNATVVNRPSDGYERSVSSSLMVVSTAEATNAFDHVLISSDKDYLTVGSSLELNKSGVSSTGNSAEIPDGTEWEVSDPAIGTMQGDVFTAKSKGTVDINIKKDGAVLGTKTLQVVTPDKLEFTQSVMDAIYGEKQTLPLVATYNENQVQINPSDIRFQLGSAAGTIDGFDFTGNEESGIKTTTVTAMLSKDYSVSARMSLALYSKDEARFDFDTAMYGDRNLAWNREVTNSEAIVTQQTEEQPEHYTYYIDDPDKDMVTKYTFALDMRKVAVPDQLVPLLQMVAGGDLESVTAWDILLQLAERVSEKTTIDVAVKCDPNMDVDYSNIKLVTDYFSIKSKTFDEETNTLTVSIGWIKQSQAIDADSANPIVIVSGIALTPKDDAAWNAQNQLDLVNSGNIDYDIYLGASQLYSMSNQAVFQQQYGIYPYSEPENTAHPNGGHFASRFQTFEDAYTLDKTVKNGWVKFNGKLSYYQDNVALTGIQKLPGYQDENNEYYYDLGDDGEYAGKLSGMFEMKGRLYYAVNGVLKTGWRDVTDSDGNDQYYYFNPKNGAAVNGNQTIDKVDYVFEDYKLIAGSLVWKGSNTLQYYWAGAPIYAGLIQVDGEYYYFSTSKIGVLNKDYYITKTNGLLPKGTYHFDEKGRLVIPHEPDEPVVEPKNGLIQEEDGTLAYYKDDARFHAGLINVDGAYYYIKSNGTAVKSSAEGETIRYYVSNVNDTGITKDWHEFGYDGKMIIE